MQRRLFLVSLAGLTVLDTSSGGANVTFRDFGVFPDDEAFAFRFANAGANSLSPPTQLSSRLSTNADVAWSRKRD